MSREIARILVPVDGSEPALEGLRFAETLAQASHASLLILHVMEAAMLEVLKVKNVGDDRFGGLNESELETLVRRHIMDPYFETAKQVMENDALEIELHSATGSPSAEICKFAKEADVDLIVMGARGASDFKELLLGGVASQVLHHAPCPVTIVR